jgi:hypothetical protein
MKKSTVEREAIKATYVRGWKSFRVDTSCSLWFHQFPDFPATETGRDRRRNQSMIPGKTDMMYPIRGTHTQEDLAAQDDGGNVVKREDDSMSMEDSANDSSAGRWTSDQIQRVVMHMFRIRKEEKLNKEESFSEIHKRLEAESGMSCNHTREALKKRWDDQKLEEKVLELMQAEEDLEIIPDLVKVKSVLIADDEKGVAEDASDEEESNDDDAEDPIDGEVNVADDDDHPEDFDDGTQEYPEAAGTDNEISVGLSSMGLRGERRGATKHNLRHTTRMQSLVSARKTGGNVKRRMKSPGNSGNGRTKRTKKTDAWGKDGGGHAD